MKSNGIIIHVFLVFFIAFQVSVLYAQLSKDLPFYNITKLDGLPSNYVTSLTNDQAGFLWVATNNGLGRYDGPNTIQVFQVDTINNKEGLASNFIQTIFSDSKNNLWIGTRLGGLTRYHLPSNSWKTFQHNKEEERSISHNDILSIHEDSQQRLWIGTENGLNLYDARTETFKRFLVEEENPYSLKQGAILSIQEDDKGWLWVGTWAGGVHLLLTEKGETSPSGKFRNFLPSVDKRGHNVWKIYQDHQKKYWFGTHGGGVFLMDLPSTASNNIKEQTWTPQFHNYSYEENNKNSLANNVVHDIYQDIRGRIWFATLDGLSYSDDLIEESINNKPFLTFHKQVHDAPNLSSLATNSLSSILEDKQGLLWFGTIGGISQYNYNTSQFSIYHCVPDGENIPNTQSIAMDNFQNIWLAAGATGLVRYSATNNQLENITQQYPNLLLDNEVYAIYSPDKRQFFVGTKSGLTIVDSKTWKTKTYPVPKWIEHTIPNFIIQKIFVDEDGIIWLGTEIGLFTISTKGEYLLHTPIVEEEASISDNAITDIFQDSKGSIWVATYKGLNRVKAFNGKATKFERFLNNPNKPKQSIPVNQILSLAELDDRLYFGTTAGLYSYHLSTKQFESYSTSEHNSFIFTIQLAQNNQLWLSTSESLFSFDPIEKNFNNFTKADGVGDGIFRHGSGIRDVQGNIYFGTTKGFVQFQPKEVLLNTVPPPVYITSINKMSADTSLFINGTYLKELSLAPKDYYTAFNFAALNYQQAEKNKYSYQLEGFEDAWHTITFGQPIIYRNLSPQTYTLKIKAANNDGVWNDSGASLKIIKQPAFWQTWWFRLLNCIGALLILLGGINLYTTSIRNRNLLLQDYNSNLKKEIEERKRAEHNLANREIQLKAYNKKLERSNKDLEQFAYIASHDLQSPLNTIISFSGLLEKSSNNKLEKKEKDFLNFITSSARNMQELISAILEFSRINNQKLQCSTFNISHLVETIQLELNALLIEKKANLKIGSMPEMIHSDKIKIKQLLQNLITNGIKFSKQGVPPVIVVNCIEQAEYWQFQVKDNGIGISKEFNEKIFQLFQRLHTASEYKGTGIGLALCKKLVTQLEGDIWLESELGEGCAFFFTVKKYPISKNENRKEAVFSLDIA